MLVLERKIEESIELYDQNSEQLLCRITFLKHISQGKIHLGFEPSLNTVVLREELVRKVLLPQLLKARKCS